MRERLDILYQFDEKYAPYAGVSMTSLLENNKSAKRIYIYILGDKLSGKTVERFKSFSEKYTNVQIKFPDIQKMISNMKDLGLPTYRGSYAANLRMFLDEFVDADADRVLYLDADTIINRNIESIFSYGLSGKTLGMVLESLTNAKYKEAIGIGQEAEYFNSGVILYDMEKWRKRHYKNRIIEHIRNVRSNYPCPDQDLINIICKEDICRMPIKYNFQPFHRVYKPELYFRVYKSRPYYAENEIKEGNKHTVIYHCYRYIGEFPWHRDALHPFTDEFDKYLVISPWADYVKGFSGCGVIVTIEKILYGILPEYIFLLIFKAIHDIVLRNAEKASRQKRLEK